MSTEKKPKDMDNTEGENEGDDDGWIGPMPSEATKPKPKKRKGTFLSILTVHIVW